MSEALYDGHQLNARPIITGYKATRGRRLTPGQKQANRILAAGRAPVEHGFANLKAWRVLTKLRTNPAHATALLPSARPDRPRSQPMTDDRRTIKTANSRAGPARAPRPSVTPAPLNSRFEDGEASVGGSAAGRCHALFVPG
ncbi:transposase family protein [Streptomyces violascens]|uniref:transposase family protein n=1 Tax=Streptomyces violascens TaxID=67381 RepID=UPI003664666B